MGNKQYCATLRPILKVQTKLPLSVVVQCTGGLIHHQQPWIRQDSSGNRNALTLTTTEIAATLGQRSGITLPQTHNEFMGAGNFGCFQNRFSTSLGIIQSDIFSNSPFKQKRVLGNNADLASQTRQVHLGDVVIVNKNAALLRLIQAWQQLHQCALATATLAHNTNKATGLNR